MAMELSPPSWQLGSQVHYVGYVHTRHLLNANELPFKNFVIQNLPQIFLAAETCSDGDGFPLVRGQHTVAAVVPRDDLCHQYHRV